MMKPLSKEKLILDLKMACKTLSDFPVLIHSDLLKIGLTKSPNNREAICQDYEEALLTALPNCPFLIPTFNYDFCKTGIYDPVNSASQVGAFTDYFRLQYPKNRTKTPVFNFVINHSQKFPFEAVQDVFGKSSTFAKLHKQKGYVFFLGADFASNTFIHYIEEASQIGYRYVKSFSGVIQETDGNTPITIYYRVRPLHTVSIIYHWDKLQTDAKNEGILKEFSVGNGKLLYYQSDKLFDFWTSKLSQDPFYLLTPESKAEVLRFGSYPFTLEHFENPKNY